VHLSLEGVLKLVFGLSAVASLAVGVRFIASYMRIVNRLRTLEPAAGNVVAIFLRNVVTIFLRLNGLQIALPILVFSISSMSLYTVIHWDSHWRDVPAWMWGLVAALAAATVAGIAVFVNRWRNRKEAAKRTRWRAKRAAIRVDDPTASEGGSTVPIELENRGLMELYEVQWFLPLIVYSDGRTDSVTRATDATITGARRPLAEHQPETLQPRQSRRLYVHCDSHDGERRPLKEVIPLVTFFDADGNRIGRVLGKRGTPPFQSEWAIVDDCYPATVRGGLGKLLNKL